MTREEVLAKVNEVICDVLDDEDITVTEATVSDDVEGWDSLTHITIVGSVEAEFDIKFAMKDVAGMKNVGHMVDLIMEQLS